jgi:thiol-disulfide isomerase/thioredoxin
MKAQPLQAVLLALALLWARPVTGGPPLPWEKDYEGALAKAKAEKRPLFLMLTATWCGPCKMLESRTLPSPAVFSSLKEFVWVKAYEDAALNKEFNMGGYPTLVFLDASNGRVLERTTGYEPPGPFLRHVIAARQAAKLPLSQEMEELQAKAFVPDEKKIESLIQSGDTDGLVKYLAPAREDALRDNSFLVAKLRLPPGVKAADVQATVYSDYPVPDSGVLVIPVPRDGKTAPLRIMAPGCKAINEEIGVDEKTAGAVREFALERLSAKEAASFSGRVLQAGGRAAPKAIVRICDWDVTRADGEGRFEFARVTPGTLVVRGEAPGGELQKELTFVAGQELKEDLPLKAVTTVGIRWALQSKEGSRELTGEGVRTGEAYFSVEHSRFLLSRGAEVPQAYGSDFMLMADWQGVRQYIEKEQVAKLEASNGGAPIFWLFDKGSHENGLHAEKARFEDIRAVNDGKAYDEKSYFKFLRGETVRQGQVYTVRCVRKDCCAKMEITDVTMAAKATAKSSGD